MVENYTTKRNLLFKLIDKTSFAKIFLIWIILLLSFGVIYYITANLNSKNNFLLGEDGNRITGLVDGIYFSIITATSTGYGDIIPKGIAMRFIVIFNVVMGVLMMSIVTSKLVSMKQEKLLEQIYHLSYSENLNTLLAGLAVFRADADNMLRHLKTREIGRKTLFSLKTSLSSLKHHMSEIRSELQVGHHITQKNEKLIIELILSRMSLVFDKIEDIIEIMKIKQLSFKNPSVLEEIYIISNMGEQIAERFKKEIPVLTNKIDDVNASINRIRQDIMSFKIVSEPKEIHIHVNPDILTEIKS